jgi:hypothetical protein
MDDLERKDAEVAGGDEDEEDDGPKKAKSEPFTTPKTKEISVEFRALSAEHILSLPLLTEPRASTVSLSVYLPFELAKVGASEDNDAPARKKKRVA